MTRDQRIAFKVAAKLVRWQVQTNHMLVVMSTQEKYPVVPAHVIEQTVLSVLKNEPQEGS